MKRLSTLLRPGRARSCSASDDGEPVYTSRHSLISQLEVKTRRPSGDHPYSHDPAAHRARAPLCEIQPTYVDNFGSPSPPKNINMRFESPNETGRTLNSTKTTSNLNLSTVSNNYVGFANFPNQVFRRAVRNGFDFTLMVVGRSGLGKSTFINTLFLAEINDPNPQISISAGSTVKIDQKAVRLTENGVTLNLTLVDTPGFGGAIDNSKCWEPIQEFVDARYLEYLSEETKLDRPIRVVDKCVHLCLYFIAPSGHGLASFTFMYGIGWTRLTLNS